MQKNIKSWHIALSGVAISMITQVIIMRSILPLFSPIFFLIIIIIALLYFRKTRILGAVLSLILGFYMISAIKSIFEIQNNPFIGSILTNIMDEEKIKLLLISYKISIVSGVFYILAGAHYFWKKE